MKEEITGLVVLIFLFTAATLRFVVKEKSKQESFVGDDKEIYLWWVIDDKEGNTGVWLDWGARLLRQPNSPFLNVHLRRVRELHEPQMRVVPLLGRDDVHKILKSKGVIVPAEADIAPGWLWRAWASAQMVCYVGGLWVDSHALFLKSALPAISEKKALRFGSYSANDKKGSGDYLLWGIDEGCGLWKGYAEDMDKLMKGGPLSWTAQKIRRAIRYLQDKHLSEQIEIHNSAEWSTDNEKLLSRYIKSETKLPPTEVIYVPVEKEAITRSIPNAWFLRLSEEQLMKAEFLWARLARTQIQ